MEVKKKKADCFNNFSFIPTNTGLMCTLRNVRQYLTLEKYQTSLMIGTQIGDLKTQ